MKDKPIPDGDNVNASQQSVNADKEMVGPHSETINGHEESDIENCYKVNVLPDLDTVNGDEHGIDANSDTVTPENDNCNPDEDMLNGNPVHIIVPVKTEQNEAEDVKPNLENSVLHVNSAVNEQSAELFSDCSIKKEESADDPAINNSPISVKGTLSDEF